MRRNLILFLSLTCFLSCNQAQQPGTAETHKEREVGGYCEGCEALLEYRGELSNTDTIPGFEAYEPKLVIKGTVYQNDGVTPASDVIVYFYHTNREGIYEPTDDPQGWEKRHGQHRGWIRTDDSGAYKIYTFRPASYPNTSNPQHVHITVKEPDTNPYYITSIHFKDDPLMQDSETGSNPRGGPGLCEVDTVNGVQYVTRDIMLGENIPGYN
ncbi:MAG: intradiol ring-cleavage dioxygenase [Saprospiraceae bacterium]|nr:intradiol ring-cleavage dioxygenase [Saprospiraceae bacterium]